jgi:hypothetical protein
MAGDAPASMQDFDCLVGDARLDLRTDQAELCVNLDGAVESLEVGRRNPIAVSAVSWRDDRSLSPSQASGTRSCCFFRFGPAFTVQSPRNGGY